MRYILYLLMFLLTLLANAQTHRHTPLPGAVLEVGSLRLRVDARQRLVVDHFEAGRRTRQDMAPLAHLDPDAMAWSPGDQAVVLRCLHGRRNCISSELFDPPSAWRSSHSMLPVPDHDAHGQRTMATIQALARAAHDPLVDAIPVTR